MKNVTNFSNIGKITKKLHFNRVSRHTHLIFYPQVVTLATANEVHQLIALTKTNLSVYHLIEQRLIPKFPHKIHNIYSQEKFQKVTTQACRMVFFTLVTQVTNQSDHPDTCVGQTHKDLLISAYGRKCLEKKKNCCHIGNTANQAIQHIIRGVYVPLSHCISV